MGMSAENSIPWCRSCKRPLTMTGNGPCVHCGMDAMTGGSSSRIPAIRPARSLQRDLVMAAYFLAAGVTVVILSVCIKAAMTAHPATGWAILGAGSFLGLSGIGIGLRKMSGKG